MSARWLCGFMGSFMSHISDVEELYDFIGYVVLCAPDDFPNEDYLAPEEQMTLDRAYAELRNALGLLDPEVAAGKLDQASSLLEQSLAAYRAADVHSGAHLLQDFQDLFFTSEQ